MKSDLFGEIRVVEGYDPDDEPGRFGISFNRLKQLVECNPEEGWAKWKIDRRAEENQYGKFSSTKPPKAKAGDLLPWKTRVDKKFITLPHIIWVFHTNGVWAENMIDHRDGDKSNNKSGNLRDVTNTQNQMNVKPRGPSGIVDVHSRPKNRWRACIKINGVYTGLGTFDKFEDAVAARYAAEDKYFGEFAARHSRPDYGAPPTLKGPDLFS